MATNPMQRKARNSFLIGMVVALIIAAIPVVFLFNQAKKLQEKIDASNALLTQVYVLNQDVKSGQTVTQDMFSLATATRSAVPSNATSDILTTLREYSLCDKEGNEIKTDNEGLYMEGKDSQKIRIYKEEVTDNYYKLENNNKVYIELNEKPLIAKIDLKANTIITTKYLARSDEMTTNDQRTQEYNMLVLPSDLTTGDFVDIRLMLPNGQDYIVLSKKEVTVPMYNGTYSSDTVIFNMKEDELLVMSSAIVDAYWIDGAKLYAIKYVEPGNQESATPTYIASNDIIKLINKDPNILPEAMNALKNRYQNSNNSGTRGEIESQIKDPTDNSSVISGIEESITSTQESRQQYLDSLTSGATAY